MKEITLTNGMVALVDDEDYVRISQHNWIAHIAPYTQYAYRNLPRKRGYTRYCVKMHREIMGVTDPKIDIDHIDGNGLNNQKSNLRLVTRSQNVMNSKVFRNNQLGIKGVRRHKGHKSYEARITVNYKLMSLGFFETIEEAAAARKEAEAKYHGQYARQC